MNASDLLQLGQDLWQLSEESDRLLLAQAALWLNPLDLVPDLDHDDDNSYYIEPIENLPYTLDLMAEFFPTPGYSQAVQLLWSGKSWKSISRELFKVVARELNVDEDVVLFSGLYSIPLQQYGLSRGDIDPVDFCENHSRLLPALLALGVDPLDEENDDLATAFEIAEPAAAIVMRSLAKGVDPDPGGACPNPARRDVAWLVSWLFGLSGNTLIDWSDSDYAEAYGEGLAWSEQNLAFAREMQSEANAIYAAAMRGLEWFETDPELREALGQNFVLAAQHWKDKKERGDKYVTNPDFHWPEHNDGTDGAAAPDQPEHLPLWHTAAEVESG